MRYAFALALATTATVIAQTPADAPRALTAADYARAEKFMTYNTTPLVLHGGVRADVAAGRSADRFWYRDDDGERARGDARRCRRTATRVRVRPAGVPAAEREDAARRRRRSRYDELSPDGKRAAFIRDWNLWVRDVATGQETQLTTDGVKDFGYATDNAGWTQQRPPDPACGRPTRRRSRPSSRTSASVGEMYLVDTSVGHPTLQAWKYPLPGDEIVTMIQRVVIDVDAGEGRAPADAARSAPLDALRRRGVPRRRWGDVQWSAGRLDRWRSSRPRAITSSEQLRVADAATGAVRDVLEEKVETFFESGNGRVNWRYLPASNEVIWFSRARQLGPAVSVRPADRPLKHPITSGEGNVTQLLRVDEKNRACCTSSRVGREKGRDPYFRHFYRVGFDGKNLAAADAGGRRPRRHAVAVGPLLRRQLLEARRAAGRRAARRRRQADR